MALYRPTPNISEQIAEQTPTPRMVSVRLMLQSFSRFFSRKPKDPEIVTDGAVADYRNLLVKGASPDELADAHAEAAEQVSVFAGQDIYLKAVVEMFQAFGGNQEMKIEPEPRRVIPGVARAEVDFTGSKQHYTNHFYGKPTGMQFASLRAVYRTDPVIAAIVNTQINLVSRFIQPSTKEWVPGFKIRFKSRRRNMTDTDADRFDMLEDYLMSCGMVTNAQQRRSIKRDDLPAFIAKHLRDSLICDHAPIELMRTPLGRAHGFKAVDAARVLLTDPTYGAEHLDFGFARDAGLEIPDTRRVFAVLLQDGQPVAPYSYEDLLLVIRNPDTDESRYGYGEPEIESIMQVIEGFMNALEVNFRGITHNSIPRGILNLFGDYEAKDVQLMKQQITAQARGAKGFWALPMLISKDKEGGGQFIPIGTPPNEVMFSRWLTLQVAIKCARFGLDPSQVNFDAFKTSTGALSGGDTEEKIAAMRDSGFYPLIKGVAKTLNEILDTVDNEVEMYWTGLEADQQKSREDDEKMLTWNEYRARRGERGVKDKDLGEAPMNAALLGMYQAVLQQKQAAQNPPQQPMPENPNAALEQGQPPQFQEAADHDGNEYEVQNQNPTSQPQQNQTMQKALDLERWI